MIQNLLLIFIIYNILLSINILISYYKFSILIILSMFAASALSIILSISDYLNLAMSVMLYFIFLIIINILLIDMQFDNSSKEMKISKCISFLLLQPQFEFIKRIIYKNNYIHSNKLDFKTNIDNIKITNPEALEHLAIINNKLIPSYVKIIKLNKKLKKHYYPVNENNKKIIKNKILEEIKLMNIDKNKDIINSEHEYQFIKKLVDTLSDISFNISIKIDNYKDKKMDKAYQEIKKIKKEIKNL